MATKTKAKAKTRTIKLAEVVKRKPPKFVAHSEVAAAFNPDSPYATWRGNKSYLLSYNPDDLVKSRSRGIQIYQEMTREPVVKAALMQKVTSLLSVPWGVKPASSSAEHVAQAKFVTWNLKNLRGGFARDIYEMCDALVTGYSIQEKIYEIVESGEYSGMVRLAALKSKDPYYFGFAFDEFMNLNPDGVVMTLSATGEHNTPLPADKFFIFSYLKKYENLYGQSDLRAAYRAFWIKDTAWKLRSVYMERFSGNNLKGKYPRNKHAAENKAALIEVFRAWQNETGVAIPEDLEIEVLQLSTTSDSEYARAMADCNKDIAIGILGETLTMDEGRKTGARNMGEIHKEIVDLFVLFLDMILTADIKEGIVRDIIDTNYAGVTEYPEFYWYPREDYDPVKFGEAVKHWQEAGAKVSKSWFYERTRMPIPAGEADVLKPPKPPATPNPFGQGQATTESTENGGAAGKVNGDGNGDGNVSAQVNGKDNGNGDAAKLAEPRPGEYFRELSPFEKFAEIPKVDMRMRRLVDRAVDKSRPAYEKIFESIASQVEKKDVLGKQDFEAAARIAVNPAPLKASIFRGLLTANMIGRADVVMETQNQGFDFGRIRKFAEARFNLDVVDEPFTPEEAVSFFSGKVPMTKDEFTALADGLQNEAFYVAGLEKGNIDRDVKALLTDALKNGMSLDEFKFKLDELGVKYATPAYGLEGTVGEGVLGYHAETAFRTNMMSAYNAGKREMYQDEEVKEFFPAFEYTAIMDNRTSDICMNLDGTRRLSNDPIWNEIWPPNHHNCRSTVISINKYDFNRDMITEEETAAPAAGFGG